MQSERLSNLQLKPAFQILDYLRIEDSLAHADAIFVFGSRNIGVADKAADLYHSGFAPIIYCMARGSEGSVAEGGIESEVFKRKLTENGVPEESIVVSSTATNTLEEVLHFKDYLSGKSINLSTVILITHPYHQRRAFATFYRWLHEIALINAPADITYDFTSKKVLRIADEVERIKKYAAKGDIAPQNIPEKILNAVEIIKEYHHSK